MKKKECLSKIRKLEKKLYSHSFGERAKKQSKYERIHISDCMINVTKYRSRLETGELKIIASKLDKLAPELEKGMADLKKQIDETNDFIAILGTLTDVLRILGKVASLAV